MMSDWERADRCSCSRLQNMPPGRSPRSPGAPGLEKGIGQVCCLRSDTRWWEFRAFVRYENVHSAKPVSRSVLGFNPKQNIMFDIWGPGKMLKLIIV